jgi:hypothetical protein
MPGASEQTRRVKNLNANWHPAYEAPDGTFELQVITSDDERYGLPVSPSAMTALAALAQAETVFAWDPTNRTLIIANLVGTMPWTQRS